MVFIQKVTAADVREQALTKCGAEDEETLLHFLCEQYAKLYNAGIGDGVAVEEIRGFHETVVACLVAQLGGEARIPLTDIEDPPPLYMDDDPISGDWIYATKSVVTGQTKAEKA